MRNIFQIVDYSRLIDIFFEAEEYIYLAAPGFYEECSEAIIEVAKYNTQLDIQLIIDPTEDGFRKYYGDIDVVEELVYCDIKIKEFKYHRLGFIITDKSAFFLFNQSRAIEKEPKGYNSIKMSAANKTAIKLHCFTLEGVRDLGDNFSKEVKKEIDELNEVTNELSLKKQTDYTPPDLDKCALGNVADSLNKNPAKYPDFERLIKVYSTKIKFVEFEVKGINITNKSIQIPNDILSLSDRNLHDQIKTRLDIFDEDLKKKTKELTKPIKEQTDKLRKQYLCRVSSRNKSVLWTVHKSQFLHDIKQLEEDYENIQEQIKKLVQDALNDINQKLIEELSITLKKNLTGDLNEYAEGDQLEMFNQSEPVKIDKMFIIPSPEKLVSSLEIIIRFFDPTYEDFKDKKFVKELFEKGFINEEEKQEIVRDIMAMGIQPATGSEMNKKV